MIKAIIVDDEQHCCDSLSWLLSTYCPEISIQATCNSGESAIRTIRGNPPQMVFLDVEMPGMTGFQMLEKLSGVEFDIIFTTAFDRYAIHAIRCGAMDYLLKPVDKDELRNAVDNFLHRTQRDHTKQLSALLTHLRQSNDLSWQKAAFPTQNGLELVLIKDIMVCEGSSNYTNIHLREGKHLLVSKTLKEIAEILEGPPFFRIHHSFLVNMQYIIRYIKGEGGFVVLTNEMTLPVSRSKKEELLKMINR